MRSVPRRPSSVSRAPPVLLVGERFLFGEARRTMPLTLAATARKRCATSFVADALTDSAGCFTV